MKITDIQGLYVATNTDSDFTILVVAEDENDAKAKSMEYFNDADIDFANESSIEISEFTDVETHFDCDYAIQ